MGAGQPMIIAHRGAKGMAPENTLAAFRSGLEQGCKGIELDVHLTADGEIIVCHDDTLERITDGKGRIDKTWTGNLGMISGASAIYSKLGTSDRVKAINLLRQHLSSE